MSASGTECMLENEKWLRVSGNQKLWPNIRKQNVEEPFAVHGLGLIGGLCGEAGKWIATV